MQEPPDGRAAPQASSSRAARISLIILATIASLAALHYASALVMPVVLALFFAVVLSPAVERFRRLGLPNPVAAALVMLILLGGIAGVMQATIEPARDWIQRAPRLLSDVERKLRPLKQVAVQIDKVAAQAERVTSGSPTSTAAGLPDAGRGVLSKTPAVLVPVAGVFFLTLFFLASGPPLLTRLGARRRTGSARRLVIIVERVRRETARFLGTIALINIGLGIVTTAIAAAFELPTPYLWGVMAALLNFIPYAGSATTFVTLTIVAIVTHDTLAPAFGVALSFLLAATIEGQLVQPLALGRRLALSPLIVFLGLWLWGWLWGVAGLLLATPILLTLKSVSCQVTGWGPLAELLSPSTSPVITPRARAWRRAARRRRRSIPPSGSRDAPLAPERESGSTLV